MQMRVEIMKEKTQKKHIKTILCIYSTLVIILLNVEMAWAENYNLPINENGWSTLTPTDTTRFFYISNISGNNQTARYYTLSDSEVSHNPLNPNNNIKPYSSIDAVWKEIRNSENGVIHGNDWILYKRGESWIGQPGRINNFSGINKENPMVLSSYGDMNDPRPIFNLTGSGIYTMGGAGNRMSDNYWFISGLQFSKHTR